MNWEDVIVKFKVGDEVIVVKGLCMSGSDLKIGDVRKIFRVDEDDEHLPYKLEVLNEKERATWVSENAIEFAPQQPLKRDSIVSLEVTGEELFWIRALTGATNGRFTSKSSLFIKAGKFFPRPFYFSLIEIIDLCGKETEVESLINEVFSPEPEEMTLEEVCKELGRDIKIVKDKE